MCCGDNVIASIHATTAIAVEHHQTYQEEPCVKIQIDPTQWNNEFSRRKKLMQNKIPGWKRGTQTLVYSQSVDKNRQN